MSPPADAEAPVLLHEEDGGVAVLTLNAPARRNALTVEMGELFSEKVREIGASRSVRAVVLTGAGKAFSAGGDLAFLDARAASSSEANVSEMLRFYRRFLVLRQLDVPVIAAIQGHAVGAGLCIALATDLRFVATEAKIGVTFVGLGLHPGMGATHFLPQLIGYQRAADLLLSGRLIDGQTAVAMGLAADHLPADEVLTRSVAAARDIAKQGPIAVRALVRTLRNRADRGLDEALVREADAQAVCYASEDLRVGVQAIREKKAPQFEGR